MSQNSRHKKPNDPKKKSEQPNEILRYTGISIKMATVIVLGVLLGRWLDGERDFPVFTLICSLLSVALAIYIIVKDTSR